MLRNNKTLNAIASAFTATSALVETVSTKTASIAEYSLGSLENVAKDAEDYTRMVYLDHATERRTEYMEKYADTMANMSPALLAMCESEVQ